MDEVLRPNAAATLKHSGRDPDDEPEPRNRRRSSLHHTRRSVTDSAEPDGRRRSGRQRPQGHRPLYDASRKALDDALDSDESPRGRKQRVSLDDATSDAASDVMETVEFADAESGLSEEADNNLLTRSFLPAWSELGALDKLLYSLQHGLPDKSTVLPRSWEAVAQMLIKEGHFTRKQYGRWGGKEMVRKRYRRLRQGLLGDAAAKEPCSKNEWPIKWAEGWDVFATEPGKAYVDQRVLPTIKGLSANDKLVLEGARPSDVEEDDTINVDDDGSNYSSQTRVDPTHYTVSSDSSTSSSDEEDVRESLREGSDEVSSCADESDVQLPNPKGRAPIARMGRGMPRVLDSDDSEEAADLVLDDTAGSPVAAPLYQNEAPAGATPLEQTSSSGLFMSQEQPTKSLRTRSHSNHIRPSLERREPSVDLYPKIASEDRLSTYDFGDPSDVVGAPAVPDVNATSTKEVGGGQAAGPDASLEASTATISHSKQAASGQPEPQRTGLPVDAPSEAPPASSQSVPPSSVPSRSACLRRRLKPVASVSSGRTGSRHSQSSPVRPGRDEYDGTQAKPAELVHHLPKRAQSHDVEIYQSAEEPENGPRRFVPHDSQENKENEEVEEEERPESPVVQGAGPTHGADLLRLASEAGFIED